VHGGKAYSICARKPRRKSLAAAYHQRGGISVARSNNQNGENNGMAAKMAVIAMAYEKWQRLWRKRIEMALKSGMAKRQKNGVIRNGARRRK